MVLVWQLAVFLADEGYESIELFFSGKFDRCFGDMECGIFDSRGSSGRSTRKTRRSIPLRSQVWHVGELVSTQVYEEGLERCRADKTVRGSDVQHISLESWQQTGAATSLDCTAQGPHDLVKELEHSEQPG